MLVVAVSVFLLCLAAQAQQSSSSDQPASREHILKLFEVMQVEQQMHNVMEQVLEQTKQMSHEALRSRHPDISAEDLARMDAISEQTMKDFPIAGVLEDMVPVYQKHLSATDVAAMISFYSTPTGQKLLREMPAMTAEGMQAMYPRLQKQMDETMRKVEQMASQESEKKKQAAPSPETRKN